MTKAWEGLITTKRRRLGDPVIIDGLTTSPHLNGLRAEVWAENKKTNFWDPDTRRYGVRITSPGRHFHKPFNVKAISLVAVRGDSQGEEEAKAKAAHEGPARPGPGQGALRGLVWAVWGRAGQDNGAV